MYMCTLLCIYGNVHRFVFTNLCLGHLLFSAAGRTHRSNQVNAPEYVFLISELAGEQRFASIVGQETGEPRSTPPTETAGLPSHEISQSTTWTLRYVHTCTYQSQIYIYASIISLLPLCLQYGRLALESVLKSILNSKCTLTQSEDYPEEFLTVCVPLDIFPISAMYQPHTVVVTCTQFFLTH